MYFTLILTFICILEITLAVPYTAKYKVYHDQKMQDIPDAEFMHRLLWPVQLHYVDVQQRNMISPPIIEFLQNNVNVLSNMQPSSPKQDGLSLWKL